MWKPEPTGILQQAFRHAYNTIGPGLCLEFGVGMGHSYCWQALQIMDWAKGCVLVGFDAFEGLPEETEGVWAPERNGKGHFCYPMEILKEHMEACGLDWNCPQFKRIKGFFEDTLTKELQDELVDAVVGDPVDEGIPLMFVNIDVDIHKSTIQALDFIRPMMRPGLPIYFDDWLDPIDVGKGADKWGEHLAWEQWSAANGVKATLGETNNLNQRFLIVTEC